MFYRLQIQACLKMRWNKIGNEERFLIPFFTLDELELIQIDLMRPWWFTVILKLPATWFNRLIGEQRKASKR